MRGTLARSVSKPAGIVTAKSSAGNVYVSGSASRYNGRLPASERSSSTIRVKGMTQKLVKSRDRATLSGRQKHKSRPEGRLMCGNDGVSLNTDRQSQYSVGGKSRKGKDRFNCSTFKVQRQCALITTRSSFHPARAAAGKETASTQTKSLSTTTPIGRVAHKTGRPRTNVAAACAAVRKTPRSAALPTR